MPALSTDPLPMHFLLPAWQPLPALQFPPEPDKRLKGLIAAWRKGADTLQAARTTLERDASALAKLPSLAEALQQAGELRLRLAELLRTELQLRQTFSELAEACAIGWQEEAERRYQAFLNREAELRELLAANGWPVEAPPDLPQCTQVPDLFHRNADLARLRNAHREADGRRDQKNASSANDQAAATVRAEQTRLINGMFAGMAVAE